MQIKKIIKKTLNLLTLFEVLLITLSLSPLSADFNVFPQIILEENTARGEQYIWVYETRNGVQYKRLYDAATGKWVTDWLKVD